MIGDEAVAEAVEEDEVVQTVTQEAVPSLRVQARRSPSIRSY